MKELANLPPTLIHGDVHEDQFFVRSRSELKITGLIDWISGVTGHTFADYR
jgi:Ser/Thr protein kinase RdoA (MazF antagonist)